MGNACVISLHFFVFGKHGSIRHFGRFIVLFLHLGRYYTYHWYVHHRYSGKPGINTRCLQILLSSIYRWSLPNVKLGFYSGSLFTETVLELTWEIVASVLGLTFLVYFLQGSTTGFRLPWLDFRDNVWFSAHTVQRNYTPSHLLML